MIFIRFNLSPGEFMAFFMWSGGSRVEWLKIFLFG
jgi:hypothetical protein